METQERFPQGLENLAQNARFPHSHKPIIVVFVERRQNDGNSHSVTKPSTESDQAYPAAVFVSMDVVYKMMSLVAVRSHPGEFTMIELAETLLQLAASRSNLIFKPIPLDDPRQRQPDISIVSGRIGRDPKVAMEDGLKDTVAYFVHGILSTA